MKTIKLQISEYSRWLLLYYRRQKLHYRGNPSTAYSIPERYYCNVHRENPWYYRGITAVPITVQLSTTDITRPDTLVRRCVCRVSSALWT